MAKQRSTPAPFLTKTYQLVDDPSTDDVISWGKGGKTFVVWRSGDLANDLLPYYFKHNNLSSFVRQLNTYGFRKVVTDKWEFGNENFIKGQPELLLQIRRRKTVPIQNSQGTTGAVGKTGKQPASASEEEMGSTSTSSPAGTSTSNNVHKMVDLSKENEKLRRDNLVLISELAQTKRQYGELIAFLTECFNGGVGTVGGLMEGGDRDNCRGSQDDSSDDDDGEGLKLFGVLLKGEQAKKKRAREESVVGHGMGLGWARNGKLMRAVGVDVPWMKIPPSLGESEKLVNSATEMMHRF